MVSIFFSSEIRLFLLEKPMKIIKNHGFREHVLEHFHEKTDRNREMPQTTIMVGYIVSYRDEEKVSTLDFEFSLYFTRETQNLLSILFPHHGTDLVENWCNFTFNQ